MLRIILVENEILERQVDRIMIEKSNLPITIVAETGDGLEALELVKENKPDAVLVDIRIPGISGLELIKEAKKVSPNTEFVAITAYDFFNYVKEALRLGIRDYLLKPVRKEDFLHMLSELIAVNDAKQRRTADGDNIADSVDIGDNIIKSENCSEVIQTALEYIINNYTRDISLNDVADQIPLNPFYFSRMFKKEVGIPFINYLTMIRINHAKMLLATTEMSVNEVTEAVGYRDANYFSRTFKHVTEQSPREYRRHSKQQMP